MESPRLTVQEALAAFERAGEAWFDAFVSRRGVERAERDLEEARRAFRREERRERKRESPG